MAQYSSLVLHFPPVAGANLGKHREHGRAQGSQRYAAHALKCGRTSLSHICPTYSIGSTCNIFKTSFSPFNASTRRSTANA